MPYTYSKVTIEHGLRAVFDCWFTPGKNGTPGDGEETVRSVAVFCPQTYAARLVAAGLPATTDPLTYYQKILA